MYIYLFLNGFSANDDFKLANSETRVCVHQLLDILTEHDFCICHEFFNHNYLGSYTQDIECINLDDYDVVNIHEI